MKTRARPTVGFVLALVVGVLIWGFVPRFPQAGNAVGATLADLTHRFGPPISGPNITLPHAGWEFVWERPAGVVVWTLRVEWNARPVGSVSQSYAADRFVRIRGLNISIPYETVARARVMVPNSRWSGP